MSTAVAVTLPPRPPPPAVLRQQEVGGAGHTPQQDGVQEREERTVRRLSGELTQASEADMPSTETRRRSYTYSTPPRRQTEHTPSPPPARNNSPAHTKPKPERPPPPSKESLRKPTRPPPPMKRAHSVPRRVQASTAVSATTGGRPYSKSDLDIHQVKANISPERAQQPEAAATPRQNGCVVSNGDHAQEPSRSSHSPTLPTTTEERSASPAGNGAPPGDKMRDTPPHNSPEGQEPRSPGSTSDGGDLPPVKPPRKRTSSKSPSQSPTHSPQRNRKEDIKATSDGDGLPGEGGATSGVTPDQPAIVPINSSTPPEGSQSTGQTMKQPSPPVESTQPVIPPRPFRPPRPFPPPSRRAPPKTRSHDLSPGSPDPQMVPSEDRNEAQSKQKSPDRSAGSPDQSRESHDKTIESHDQQGSETAASSRQNGSAQPEFVEVSLTTEVVGGAKSEGEPPPEAKTLFEINEAEDQVSPLHSSPKSRGKKLLNSMKKSFRSLRVKKSEKQPEELSKRSHSLGSHGALLATPTSHTHTYPDPLPQGVIHPLVVRCVAYLNKEEVLKEEGLFRIPGDVATIRRLRGQFVSGQDVDLSDIMDPHTVTGLLKLHFREQRVSLIPRGQPLAEVSQAVKARDLEAVRHVLSRVAVIHIATLRVITEVLVKVTEFSEVNQMTSGTLATSCGPSLFPYLPPSNANALLKFLIDHCGDLFQE